MRIIRILVMRHMMPLKQPLKQHFFIQLEAEEEEENEGSEEDET